MSLFSGLYDESIIAARSGLGMWAFVLHRITGVALIFYMLLHIVVISTSLSGAAKFDNLLKILTSPMFLTLDLGLLAAILFHAFNGIRILFFDFGIGIRIQKQIFISLMALAAIIWFITLYLTMPFILK